MSCANGWLTLVSKTRQRFTRDVCTVVQERRTTSYDNFARDFDERFVAGYTRPSAVDLLFDSPFAE